jgi:hypothetical protein
MQFSAKACENMKFEVVMRLASVLLMSLPSSEGGFVKKQKRATGAKAVRSLPSKALSNKKPKDVRGGMRKAGADPGSAGKPFLTY